MTIRQQPSGSVIVSTIALLILAPLACGCAGQPGLVATEVPTEADPQPEDIIDITPVVGKTIVNPVDGAIMVYVPEGEFLMGSDADDDDYDEFFEDIFGDEIPAHLVYLDAYWIYQTEVTNQHFARFIAATGYETTAERAGEGYRNGAYWQAPEGPGSDLSGREDHPVVYVSWYDSVAYCEWAGGRLPTEAEWEKAARGTDGRKYPWGDQSPTDQLANYNDHEGGTTPVGSYPIATSPYGALDMAGNVWEWVADLFGDYYSISPYENPTGIGIDDVDDFLGEIYVTRGGVWYADGFYRRVTYRGWSEPFWSHDGMGFRCVQLADPQ
jgi:eukaryotic-like serine/threonine-protein kinase